MALKEVVGRNLVRLTKDAASISDICRGIGIHRSQFERYLKGRSLPSDEMLARLASYFKVTAADLVSEAGIATPVPLTGRRTAQRTTPAIADGTYFGYFRLASEPRLIMRSAIFVWQAGGTTRFRRVTGWTPGADESWANSKGNHQGIVSQHLNWIYLEGRNRGSIGEPSLLALQWAPYSKPVLIGKGLVLSECGPDTARVAIEPDTMSTGVRDAIRGAHALDIADPQIDRRIIAYLIGDK